MELPELPVDAGTAVVIPALDAAASLPAAVESARRQPVDEIVIAVAPSRDGTAEVAARLARADPRVRVIDNPAGSTPVGLNRAIAATTGEVLVRCDAHVVLPEGYVDRAVSLLRDTGAANVGGRQVPTAPGGQAAAIAAAMASPLGSGGASYRSGGEAGPVDTVYLGVFRRGALKEATRLLDPAGGEGPFDERLLRNQDYELNIRLREAGGTVWFDPELAVAYRPRAGLRALAGQYLSYGRFKQLVAVLHPGALRLRHLAAPALIVALTAAAVLAVVGTGLPLLVVLIVYAATVTLGAATATPRLSQCPAVAAALVVMHLAWGVGFLIGPPRGRDG